MDIDPSCNAEYLLECFAIFATWSEEGRVGGIYAYGLKRLLIELDLLEGVPTQKYDAYIAEIMLRADEDGDGMLSLSEFLIWLVSEVLCLLPLARNSMSTCCPAYNRFLAYQLAENGAGVRKKSTGLTVTQWLKLCRDFSLCDDSLAAREAAQVVLKKVSGSRCRGGMEGGSRLSFVQQIRALLRLSGHLGIGGDVVIYRLLSGENPALLTDWHKRDQSNVTYKRIVLTHISSLFLEGEIESPLTWTKIDCEACGGVHARFQISNDEVLRAYCEVAGFPYVPALRVVNMRNIRAVFTRYCLKYNKGRMLEDSLELNNEEEEEEGEKEGEKAEDGLEDRESIAAPVCCCCYRSASLMELQTFWQLVTDNRTLSKALKTSSANLTAHNVERAFLQCCSISGVYCSDDGIGTHDQPIHPSELGSLTLASPPRLSSSSGRTITATRFDAGATMRDASETGRATPRSPPRKSSARIQVPHNPEKTWLGGCEGSAPSPVLILKPGPAPSDTPSHRPPVPSLGFIQFIEALRLLAEDLIAHPSTQIGSEIALLTILHDAINAGQCLNKPKPLRDPS